MAWKSMDVFTPCNVVLAANVVQQKKIILSLAEEVANEYLDPVVQN